MSGPPRILTSGPPRILTSGPPRILTSGPPLWHERLRLWSMKTPST